MTRLLTLAIASFVALGLVTHFVIGAEETKSDDTKAVPPVLNFTMKSLAGDDVNLAQYQGKVILMVNTASKCGFTPQYKDLEVLYTKYQDKGFVILGFPANNFHQQEPGTDAEISEFCTKNYGVTFPMFSKISVLEPDKAPLYKLLTGKDTDPKFPGEVKWNFEGPHQQRRPDRRPLASKVTPMSDDVVKAVEAGSISRCAAAATRTTYKSQ